MSTINLQNLFYPKSVAVIGASNRPLSVGRTVLQNLIDAGFKGPLYPVNPKHTKLDGLTVYPDVSALPETPELAVICTAAATVPGIITALGQRGTRAAVVLSSGFHRDETPSAQQLLDAARPFGLRILGPNCVGLLNPRIGLNASFAHMGADPGSLAFVAQSGALCTAVIDWARSNGVGFTHIVSLGDMLDVDFGDVLDFLGHDPATRGVLLYVEGITAPRKFLSAARAVCRNKPVLAIKAGRHEAGADAARSHTGAMAGSYAVFESAFQRCGIVTVDSIEALFDSAETLALSRRPLQGDRLAILTNGGGPGVLAADEVIALGGELASLGGSTLNELDSLLPGNWSRGNPVDIVGDADTTRYQKAFAILEHAPDVDAILAIHVPTALLPGEAAARAMLEPMSKSALPVLTCWMGGVTAEPARRLLAQSRIPAYATPKAAITAFMTLVRHRRTQHLLMQTPPSLPQEFTPDLHKARAVIDAALAEGRDMLGEVEAKSVLQAYGFTVVETRVAPGPDEAAAVAADIGFPVAIKLNSPDVTHKSDVGGVALDLASAEAVRTAARGIVERVTRQNPAARISGFSVQQMVRRPRARELIMGLATDATFGPIILFGDGGTAVEVLADKAIALPPLNMVLARDLVQRTRVYRLLRGYRDQPAADLEAIALNLVRLSQLIIDLPAIVELDINPMLADSRGVMVLDARMRIAETALSGPERMAIRPYPKELEETLELKSGERLLLRPIRPEDEAAHKRLFESMGSQDMYFRFFAYSRDFSHLQMARFTQIDYDREMAYVAVRDTREDGVETLGEVRAVTDANNEQAEFSIMVRSEMHRRGLGAALMRRIIDYCTARGTRRLIGYILHSNVAMLGLAGRLGFKLDFAGNENVVIASLSLR